jgi:hypothetical protein
MIPSRPPVVKKHPVQHRRSDKCNVSFFSEFASKGVDQHFTRLNTTPRQEDFAGRIEHYRTGAQGEAT